MGYSGRKGDSLRIAIVGVDGSGKSSCFEGVLERLPKEKLGGIGDEVFVFQKGQSVKPRVKYLKIKRFLGKKAKNIRNRTLYKALKFTELILRVKLHDQIEKRYKPEIMLTDGTPLINTMGWGSFYKPDIFREDTCKDVAEYLTGTRIPASQRGFYRKYLPEILLVNMLGVRFQKPDVVFFLKVSPDVAMSRVGGRGKERQVHETEAFLGKLQEAYLLVCKILSEDIRIYIIDTDKKTLEQVIRFVVSNETFYE